MYVSYQKNVKGDDYMMTKEGLGQGFKMMIKKLADIQVIDFTKLIENLCWHHSIGIHLTMPGRPNPPRDHITNMIDRVSSVKGTSHLQTKTFSRTKSVKNREFFFRSVFKLKSKLKSFQHRSVFNDDNVMTNFPALKVG